MIDLYTWSTPNGRKVSIMLEELVLPYEVHPINIGKGEQFNPDYVAINPNSKIPSIVDRQGPDGKPVAMMESGAILIYLAGDYSIADIATYPWVARYEWHKTDLNDFPYVKRWFDAISARPAVQRGMKVPS